jgi:hypothetical protein
MRANIGVLAIAVIASFGLLHAGSSMALHARRVGGFGGSLLRVCEW